MASATAGLLLTFVMAPTNVWGAWWFDSRAAVCGNGNLLFDEGTFYVRSNGTGRWLEVDSGASGLLMTGSDGWIYRSDGIRLDCDGRVLGQAPTRDLMSNPTYHVVEDENGRYLFFGGDGAVDSRNVLHIIENRSGQIRYLQIASNSSVILDVSLNNSMTFYGGSWVAVDSEGRVVTAWVSSPTTVHYARLDERGAFVVDATEVVTASDRIRSIAAALGAGNNVYLAFAFPEGGEGRGPYFVRIDPNGSVAGPATNLLPGSAPVETSVLGMELSVEGSLHLLLSWYNASDPGAGLGPWYLRLDASGRILEGPTLVRPPPQPPAVSWLPLAIFAFIGLAIIWALLQRGPRRSRERRWARFSRRIAQRGPEPPLPPR